MLWITDADVTEIANGLMKGGPTVIDSLLQNRFESVTLK